MTGIGSLKVRHAARHCPWLGRHGRRLTALVIGRGLLDGGHAVRSYYIELTMVLSV